MKRPYLNVTFSAIKKVPTISSILIDSAIGLRNMWVKNKSMIVGISGTFRISKYSGFHENEWSFKQIGFLRFKPKEEVEQKTTTMSFVQPPMPQGKGTTKDLVKKEFNPIWILENNKTKSNLTSFCFSF